VCGVFSLADTWYVSLQDPGSKYEVRHQIGRGSFGSAFLVTNKQDKEDYVLKRVRLAKQTKWQRNSTLQERDLVGLQAVAGSAHDKAGCCAAKAVSVQLRE